MDNKLDLNQFLNLQDLKQKEIAYLNLNLGEVIEKYRRLIKSLNNCNNEHCEMNIIRNNYRFVLFHLIRLRDFRNYDEYFRHICIEDFQTRYLP
jgi:hypothetical protein